jgi:hypothetical protein
MGKGENGEGDGTSMEFECLPFCPNCGQGWVAARQQESSMHKSVGILIADRVEGRSSKRSSSFCFSSGKTL